MSRPSSPTSSEVRRAVDSNATATPISPSSVPLPTRTVAIIKNHVLDHRLDIEPRILEANFEIVKERQMEFDTETDPETLFELFGEDAESLSEGPVWVYVLERHRAVEVWNSLMGDKDPAVACVKAPNSLRALFGISAKQNGFMGSPDVATAEMQIASLFASSPPFPSTELPEEYTAADTLKSISSSMLAALRGDGEEENYAPSSVTNVSNIGAETGAELSNGSRLVPQLRVTPATQPRTTKAADLRAGIAVAKTPIRPRVPLSKEALAKTFANVPGHKRSETIAVASTAPPAVTPRMTRAAALRLGLPPPPPTIRRPTTSSGIIEPSSEKDIFDGVPGHKRRESVAVASIKNPTLAPRMNKSATLRAQKELVVPPSSFMFRTPSAPKVSGPHTPGMSRSHSAMSLHSSKPSRPASQASIRAARPAASGTSRRGVDNGIDSALSPGLNGSAKTDHASKKNNDLKDAKGGTESVQPSRPRLAPRPSSLQAPAITPRPNKSALLRAAKMNAEKAGPKASGLKPKAVPRPSAV